VVVGVVHMVDVILARLRATAPTNWLGLLCDGTVVPNAECCFLTALQQLIDTHNERLCVIDESTAASLRTQTLEDLAREWWVDYY